MVFVFIFIFSYTNNKLIKVLEIKIDIMITKISEIKKKTKIKWEETREILYMDNSNGFFYCPFSTFIFIVFV